LERREGGQKVKGGQLLPVRGPEWMGIRHHEQDIGLPSKMGVPYFLLESWISFLQVKVSMTMKEKLR
jgi:hypothetical protein